MKTTSFGIWALATPLALAGTPTRRQEEEKGVPKPSQIPKLGEYRSQGCWSEKGDWQKIPAGTFGFVSSGSCNDYCKETRRQWVSALQGEDCYCGKTYPPEDSITKDSECDYPCPGYDLEACGSIKSGAIRYSVFNTGMELNVEFAEGSSDDDDDQDRVRTSTTVTSPTATSTSGTTQAPSEDDDSSGGGNNSVGIAVGVVVGIVVLALVCLGGYLYMRRKKQKEEDEERRRAETINSFVGGGKSGSISGSASITDSRLDPSLAHRRMSDGSIADNQDYSRKILRVTNA